MPPCQIFHIHGVWREQGVEYDSINSSFGVATDSTKGGDQCLLGRGLSLCNTAVLKLIVSPTGYCNRFYRISLCTILLLL